MVKLLLQFIKAERTGNWQLHLPRVAAMIPHLFAMDRPNYERWLPIYISDMKELETKHPQVHQEFLSHQSTLFSSVDRHGFGAVYKR